MGGLLVDLDVVHFWFGPTAGLTERQGDHFLVRMRDDLHALDNCTNAVVCVLRRVGHGDGPWLRVGSTHRLRTRL